MTQKKNEKEFGGAPKQTARTSQEAIMTTTPAGKKVSKYGEVEFFSQKTDDGGKDMLYLIINGRACPYWLRTYQKLGISRTHAEKRIAALNEEGHYYFFTREEMRDLLGSVPAVGTDIMKAKTFVFLTEEGFYRVIQDIDTEAMDDPVAAAKVEATKNEMASVFARYKRGELVEVTQIPPPPPTPALPPHVAPVLKDNCEIGKIFVEYMGVDPRRAHATAVSETERITGTSLESWKMLVPPLDCDVEEQAYLTPKMIGIKLMHAGLLNQMSEMQASREVNQILVGLGMQTKIGKDWEPTPTGRIYSARRTVDIAHDNGSRHSGLQLLWKPGIIPLIKMHLEQKTWGQATLEVLA